MSDIGKRIKKIRLQKKIKQVDLAAETEIPVITLRQYEAGKYTPKHERLKKIADKLGVTLADLDPDQYPEAFSSPEDFFKKRSAILKEQGHERESNIDTINANVQILNDDGVKKLAFYSEDLAGNDNYKK